MRSFTPLISKSIQPPTYFGEPVNVAPVAYSSAYTDCIILRNISRAMEISQKSYCF